MNAQDIVVSMGKGDCSVFGVCVCVCTISDCVSGVRTRNEELRDDVERVLRPELEQRRENVHARRIRQVWRKGQMLGTVLLQLGEQQKPISVDVQPKHNGGKR